MLPAMSFISKIAAIEAALAAKKIAVSAFCAEARIDRSTWQRWKAGTTLPNGRTWLQVEEAAKHFALQLDTLAEVEPTEPSVMEDSRV